MWRESPRSGNALTDESRRHVGGDDLITPIGPGFKGGAAAKPIAAAAIVAGAVLSLAINWPGHLSYDSVLQLAEGRTGSYSGAHPPVMSWLLGLADALWPGATLFIAFQTALIASALLSLLMMGRRVGWVTVAVCGVVAATPQLLIYPSIVWKDVLFAGSAAAGFAGLARAAGVWDSRPWRFAWLGASGLLLALAALTRQNGAVVLPFAAIAVGWIAAMREPPHSRRRGLAYGLAFLVVTGAVATGGALALNTRMDPDATPNSPWRALQAYDLVNALAMQPGTALPVLRARAPKLETILRTEGVAAYSPVRANALEAVLNRARRFSAIDQPLAAQWADLMIRHPLLYLRARARTFAWVFLTPDHDQCLLVYTGVEGPADDMTVAGLTRRQTDWDDTLADTAMILAPTPVYSHAAYAALALGLLAFLLRRRRPPDIAVAGLLGAALTFTGSFFIISIACDYRYLYALDVAAIAGAVYAAATFRDGAGVARSGAPRSRPSLAGEEGLSTTLPPGC